MSSKVNVTEIILGHIATLSDPTGQRSIGDYVTFFLIPGLLSVLGIIAGYNLNKDVSSMLVNFGAIFTALLLSVLVLVYDQENKLNASATTDPMFDAKKNLLSQLYYNICFSIITSIILVGLCFVHSVIYRLTSTFTVSEIIYTFSYAKYLVTPVVIFVTANLMLTIVMIVKRLHAMLTL